MFYQLEAVRTIASIQSNEAINIFTTAPGHLKVSIHGGFPLWIPAADPEPPSAHFRVVQLKQRLQSSPPCSGIDN
jgi:hypothetical protein